MRQPKKKAGGEASSSTERFYQILDRLAGIEGWQDVDEEELVRQAWEAEPVPVSPEEVERVVAQWRAIQEANTAAEARRHRRRRLRRRVVIAIGAFVLLAAATLLYLAW